MGKILVTAFGSLGDVLPFIGIGSELRARGHDVTFIGNPYFATHAAEAGLVLYPVGTMADSRSTKRSCGFTSPAAPCFLGQAFRVVRGLRSTKAGSLSWAEW